MTALKKSGDAVVDAALAPLAGYFRPGVIEVQAVRPGSVVVERVGKGFVHTTDPVLSEACWRNLNQVLANWTGGQYDPLESPVVSCRLPGGHRYEGWVGRGVESGVSVSIRVFRGVVYRLADFGLVGADAERVAQLITSGANTLISGGTSTGKTSFFNACSLFVPEHERVLALQDSPELDLDRFKNHASYKVDRHGHGMRESAFLDHFMRARPDRIWLGELSFRNASAALMVMSSGHKGFMATLHSNSALAAVETAFPNRLRMSDPPIKVDTADLAAYLRTEIDLVIQIERRPEGRMVTELWEPEREPSPRRLRPPLIGGGH